MKFQIPNDAVGQRFAEVAQMAIRNRGNRLLTKRS
jgi:hypothetical protein